MKRMEGPACCADCLTAGRLEVKRVYKTAASLVFDIFLESDERIYRDILFS